MGDDRSFRRLNRRRLRMYKRTSDDPKGLQETYIRERASRREMRRLRQINATRG